MLSWERNRLGDLVETQKGYAFKSGWYCDAGRPIVKVSDFTDDSVDSSNLVCIPETIATDYLKYELETGDVVVQTVGSWPTNPASVVGKCVRVRDNAAGALLNQNAVKLSPANGFHRQFLFYLLRGDDFKTYIIGTAQGAASQAAITLEAIRGYEFDVPPLPVQQRIAEILSAYDELIENNQRRIRILEEMARTLYREWFVYFRYPGYEKITRVPSPLGDIPKGWEVKKLGQISENFDRLRKPLSKMQRAEMHGEYPYYGAAKVFDYVNDFIFNGEYLLMAEDGSVITTERAPVLQLVNEKFWPNNHTHVLRGKLPISTHFLYLGLSEVDISPYITGAAQPKITQENMNRIPFFCGPQKLHENFNRLVESMIRQSQIFQLQIQNLRRTRDLLLPRLLSGQVKLVEN